MDLRGHTRNFRHDVEAEHRIALGLRLGKRAAVDGVDDGSRILEADALADAMAAAPPASIDEPDARVVLAHFSRKRSAETR